MKKRSRYDLMLARVKRKTVMPLETTLAIEHGPTSNDRERGKRREDSAMYAATSGDYAQSAVLFREAADDYRRSGNIMDAERVNHHAVLSDARAASMVTYGGLDIARMHDEIQHRHKAVIKGIRVEIKQTPGRRDKKYDKFELFINDKKVWDGEADSVDPLNIAGGTIELFVVHALSNARIKRERGFEP